MVHMNQQHCLLCGRDFPTGLQIMGCFLCFHCEKRLVRMAEEGTLPAAPERRKLLTLYCHRGS
ncbi:MAG: hypothetical protein E7319_09065 [Clostridiales bacterium]|nr:hypothetical protein [Clostridiales bacterium]